MKGGISIPEGEEDEEVGGEPGGVWGEYDLELQAEEWDDDAHSSISDEGEEVNAYSSWKFSRSSDELILPALSCLTTS